jgi:hypothetical protein
MTNIEDDFKNRNQKSFLYGLHPERNKYLLMILDKLASDSGLTNNFASNNIENRSIESILAEIITKTNNNEKSLFGSAIKTLTRPEKAGATEWMDNQRLTRLMGSLDMIMWSGCDVDYYSDDIYVVKDKPEPINNNIELTNYNRFVKLILKPFRKYLIINGLLKDLNPNANLTDKEILDIAYKYFPWHSGGAHGWDVFVEKNGKRSLTVKEIKQFFQRYPSSRIGYILNTKTYNSGRGQHWIALEFSKDNAKMICSQGGTFQSFITDNEPQFMFDNSKTKFLHDLEENGFGLNYNGVNIQNDNFNCGLYSLLSLYYLICTKSITKTVNSIGADGKNIAHGSSNITKVRDNLVSSNDGK